MIRSVIRLSEDTKPKSVAIVLTLGTFNLAMWLFWAIVTVFGFVSSLKRMTERITERYCVRRKLRRVRLVLAVPDALIPSQGIAA